MKISRLATVLLIVFLSCLVSLSILLAQEPTSKPRFSEDGSISSGNDVIPTLTKQNYITNNAITAVEIATVTEYDLPVSPTNLLVNQTGDIWFSSFGDNAIGKLDIANEQVSVYSRTDDSGNVWGIKQDLVGDIWYTTVNADPIDLVGKFEPSTNTFIEWAVGVDVHFGLELDTNTGDVWFATTGNVVDDVPGIYKLSPIANTVTAWSTFPYIRTYDLDIDPDGNIWLTVQPGENQGVIRLNPTTNDMTVWEMPIANSRPFRIMATSSNEVWFTEYATVTNSIAQLIPSTNTLSEFRVPVSDSLPGGVYKDGSKIWFTALGANSIGELDLSSASPTTVTVLSPITLPTASTTTSPTPISYVATSTTEVVSTVSTPITSTVFGAFTMFPLPIENSSPFGIALEPSTNNVWFANIAGRIGTIKISEASTFVYLPLILKD